MGSLDLDKDITVFQSLRSFFVAHKTAATLLLLLFWLSGLYAIWNIPMRQLPLHTSNIVQVQIEAPGFAAEDLKGVLHTVENNLTNLDNIDTIKSTARNNLLDITLYFNLAANPQLNLKHVQNALGQINLPAGIHPPHIHIMDTSDYIARVLVVGDLPLFEQYEIAHKLKQELQRLAIGQISLEGIGDKTIIAQIKDGIAQSHGKNFVSIGQQLKDELQVLPIGTMGEGADKAQLMTQSLRDVAFGSIFDQDAPIKTVGNFASSPLKLKVAFRLDKSDHLYGLDELAYVYQRISKDHTSISYQGKPAFMLSVKMPRSAVANMRVKEEKLRAWETRVQREYQGQLHFYTFNQNIDAISHQLSRVAQGIAVSFLIVTLLVLCVMPFSVAFWVIIGMITCLLGTLGLFYTLPHASINVVSMFVLLMGIGIVVDDSIIVGHEAYFLWEEKGFTPEKACMSASRKPSLFASGITTIIAFAPLLFLPGTAGQIIADLPIMMSLLILLSLIEVTLVMPHHLKKTFERYESREQRKPYTTPVKRFFSCVDEKFYEPLLRFCVRFRWLVVLLVIVFTASCFNLVYQQYLKTNFTVQVVGSQLNYVAQLKMDTPEHVNSVIESRVSDALLETAKAFRIPKDDIKLVTFSNHHELTFEAHFPTGYLNRFNYYKFNQMWQEKSQLPNEVSQVETYPSMAIKGSAPAFQFALALKDTTDRSHLNKLQDISREILAKIAEIPGVTETQSSIDQLSDKKMIILNDNAHAIVGLTNKAISRQLHAGLLGHFIEQVQLPYNDSAPFITRLPRKYTDVGNINNFPITAPDGKTYRLGDIATVKSITEPAQYTHVNFADAVILSFQINPRATTIAAVERTLKERILPPYEQALDLRFKPIGLAADIFKLQHSLVELLCIALILIYFVLVFMLESWIKPLLIMTAIPIAIAGALLGLWLCGAEFSIMGFAGCFVLAGVAINDAIILFMAHNIIHGLSDSEFLEDAVIKAVRSRTPSILLTTITTVAAVMPLIITSQSPADPLYSIAITVAFGMSTVTLVLLFFLPALLTIYMNGKRQLNAVT